MSDTQPLPRFNAMGSAGKVRRDVETFGQLAAMALRDGSAGAVHDVLADLDLIEATIRATRERLTPYIFSDAPITLEEIVGSTDRSASTEEWSELFQDKL